MKENDEVFLQQEDFGRDSPIPHEKDNCDTVITVEGAPQDHQGTLPQVSYLASRKENGEVLYHLLNFVVQDFVLHFLKDEGSYMYLGRGKAIHS